jgi:hypothetical protein
MKVYQAINKVQAELAHTGISKTRTNTQGSGYKFRGIDDVFNALSPLLATHGLCILPRMLTRTCEERMSKSGGNLFYVTVEAEFDLVAAEDGSKHTIRTFGEAMDSGDKATNKAMSAAYKYAAMQAFSIPTEGDNDTENHTHEVMPKPKETKANYNLMQDHLTTIQESKTLEELQSAFKLAYKAANADVEWQKNITAAKDLMKRQISEDLKNWVDAYDKAESK